ncbi:STAS domain-containing protein [Sciscionella marina]|uniref:STAS domain-containing protein n=1 Tax=Sciscionella marina TaxID=508770 RepID=UPI00036594E7|nr:STAS domain-containing protein [Sciscionella marina]
MASLSPLRLYRRVETAGILVLTAVGEVDTTTTPILDKELDHIAAQPSVRAVVVDFSSVTFLGVAGMELLLRAAGCAAVRRREFALVVGNPAMWRTLEITGAEPALLCYGSLHEAVEAAATHSQYLAAIGKTGETRVSTDGNADET